MPGDVARPAVEFIDTFQPDQDRAGVLLISKRNSHIPQIPCRRARWDGAALIFD